MSINVSSTDVLQTVARSLVAQRKYPTIDAALKELAIGVIKNQIAYYRRRIRRLERKHKMSFDEFTAHLRGRATPAQEDDWLDWQAARNMLEDWERTHQSLANDAIH